MSRSARAGSRESRAIVHRPDPVRDRPRWAVLGPVGAIALAIGILWPRACGIRFGEVASEDPTASAVPSGEPAAEPVPTVAAPADAGLVAPAPDAAGDPVAHASVLVGKSTLMRCQDPPAAELKPSKCGEHRLDPAIVPRIEQLGSCPAAAGVSGKLALSIDLDFGKQVAKVVAGKGSATHKYGKRDDKAIEPLLSCLRAALKPVVTADDPHEHKRYVVAYPVTISAGDAAPVPAASVEKEKSASGVATVQVDTAIVRDAPSTNGQPIGRLSRGTKVSTIGTAGNWFHIRFGDGDAQEGWIFRTNIGK